MAFLKYYAIAALAPISLLFGVGLYLEPLQGDLTRLGNIAERSWGWRAPQPTLDVSSNTATSPSTIVIGDSFSAENLWQSAAHLDSQQIFLSFHWSDIGKPQCLMSAIEDLKQRYPMAKNVVVQTVERSFLLRFSPVPLSAGGCKKNIRPSIHVYPGSTSIRRAILDTKKPLPDLRYSIKAALAETKSYPQNSALGEVYVAPLTRDNLFSNKNSGLLLFYAEDLQKDAWQSSAFELAIRNAKMISDSVSNQGLKLTYAVVPDKSTIYAPYLVKNPFGKHHDIWSALSAAGVDSVDLYRNFAKEAVTMRDFYLPNDTHLSVAGFISLGKHISRHLENAGRQTAIVATSAPLYSPPSTGQ